MILTLSAVSDIKVTKPGNDTYLFKDNSNACVKNDFSVLRLVLGHGLSLLQINNEEVMALKLGY